MTAAAERGGGAAPAGSAMDEALAAYDAGDLPGAHAAFERAYRQNPRDPVHMSWYGLTLVLVERNSNLGTILVGEALRAAGPDPVLLLNSARVHLALNQRERAAKAVTRALELWPDDPRLVAARQAMGTRRPPVIPFLSRNNPLNRVLGRIRHRWAQRNAPRYELSPASLGIPLAGGAHREER